MVAGLFILSGGGGRGRGRSWPQGSMLFDMYVEARWWQE